MAVTEQDITLALQTVADPLTGQDFVAAKAIKNISIQAGAVSFDLVLGYPAKSLWDSYKQQLEHVVSQVPGVSSVKVTVSSQVVAHAAQPGVALLPQVKNIIAVASGKGGVGKSTTAANLSNYGANIYSADQARKAAEAQAAATRSAGKSSFFGNILGGALGGLVGGLFGGDKKK